MFIKDVTVGKAIKEVGDSGELSLTIFGKNAEGTATIYSIVESNKGKYIVTELKQVNTPIDDWKKVK